MTYIMLIFSMLVLTGCKDEQNKQPELAKENTTERVAITDNTENKETMEFNHGNCMVDNVEAIGDGKFTCSYEGVKHDFMLDLPKTTEQAPLVVMLHGYGESAEGFRMKVAFEEDANALGYAVVYVTGAPSSEDTTSANGWNSGVGESGNDDVGFLCGLVNHLCETYDFDSTRVYAVGFSNGAFMTHRLALEADDIFKSVVSVAGMMPERVWEEKPSDCSVGIFQVTGEKDDVVPKNSDGSANYAKAPAIEDVMAYYVEKNGLSLTQTETVGKKSVLTKYESSDSSKQVWDLLIPDGRHSWPDEQITGVNMNQLILDYLES
ncbi:MAG: PHB depolymerase family esterase [Eubacteriales bacterium]|nr:PHB depolymerase family esterase [Eubacteriales bacterium]